MTNLPSGTVTFLFTDIEGSTTLARQYPDEMPSMFARHNEILNQAIEDHSGFVFRVISDSFSASFHNANDALQAALGAQWFLHNETSCRTPTLHDAPAQPALYSCHTRPQTMRAGRQPPRHQRGRTQS